MRSGWRGRRDAGRQPAACRRAVAAAAGSGVTEKQPGPPRGTQASWGQLSNKAAPLELLMSRETFFNAFLADHVAAAIRLSRRRPQLASVPSERARPPSPLSGAPHPCSRRGCSALPAAPVQLAPGDHVALRDARPFRPVPGPRHVVGSWRGRGV